MLKRADAPLAQQTETRLYLRSLDGLRFLAFLLVFIRHSTPHENVVMTFLKDFGWAGVDLFFALSAFLFFVMLEREHAKTGRIHFGKFYLRRVLRIAPLYMLFLTGSLLFALQAGEPDAWRNYTAYVTYTHNLVAWIFPGEWRLPFAPHMWTIAYEEQVYLVLPFIIAAIVGGRGHYRAAVVILLAAAVAGTALRWYVVAAGIGRQAVYYTPIFRPETVLFGLLCGMSWTSGAYRRLPSWAYGATALAVTAGVFAWVQVHGIQDFNLHRSLTIYPLLAVIFSSLLLYVLSPGSLLGWVLSLAPFAWLGKISYGLYVWHFVALKLSWYAVIVPLGLPRDYEVQFLVALAVTVAISAVSYYAFERWFMLLKERFSFVRNRPV